MRVLVTGATGFIGRALVPELARLGYDVRAAVREHAIADFQPNVEVVRHGDLTSTIDWVPLIVGCHAVVHLAGIAHTGPETPAQHHNRVNHLATAELVSAAQRGGVARVIFVSSIRAQCGPVAEHTLTEADDPRPTDPYGISKLAAENAVRASGLPYTILRPVLVYGAGVKGNLATLAQLAASPAPLPLGGFSGRRSLVNLATLNDAIELSLQRPEVQNQTFIVADRNPIAVTELVAALRRGLGRPAGLIALPPALLRTMANMIGKGDLLSRLDGDLIASPSKLIAAGWAPTDDTAAAIEQLARGLLARQ